MNISLKKLIAVFMIVICATLFFSCMPEETDGDAFVKVALRESEGVTVVSEKSRSVNMGGNAKFKIEIDDDYMYFGNSIGASYDKETGELAVSRIYYSVTVELYVKPKSELYHLEILNAQSGGRVKYIDGAEWMSEAGEVTLSAECGSGYSFIGWSEGGYITEGGTLLSEDVDYSFYMNSSRTLYANFSNLTSYTIIYNANGGTVAQTGGTELIVQKDYSTIYSMQQTLMSDGTFVRDGYVAVGYSTKPVAYEDKASVNNFEKFSNMGGVCMVGDTGRLTLYVVWAKATEADKFNYTSDGSGGIAITGYKGSANVGVLVIPEYINNKPVTTLSNGALSYNAFTRVVIPRTVKTIEDNAFKSCTRLKEVVFFDSVEKVSDASFTSCPISTVVLNAQRLPRYSGQSEGGFCIKYERIRTLHAQNKKKIIVVSGSSTLYGLDSKKMESNFPGYSVVNYGTNAENSSIFFMDAFSEYLTEGDILIHAPEFSDNPMGGKIIRPKLFRGNEQCYDIFREVDMTKYTGFWNAFYTFQIGNPSSNLSAALSMSGKTPQLSCNVNMYGDLEGAHTKPTKDSFGAANTKLNKGTLNYNNLNDLYNTQMKPKGVIMLMSFATYDKSRMNPSYTNQTAYDEYTNYCKTVLNYPVISNVGAYIMEHKYFYNSEWHCTDEGALLRTAWLSEDLRNYLNTKK